MYQEGGEVGFEQIADLAKRYRDNIGLPVEEGMFTPEGGFTKEGYARKFGVEPESFDIDTVFFKSPANYSFRFVDKKGEPIKSTTTKGQSRTTMLPILSDMLKQKAAEKIDVTDFDNIQKRMKQAQMENTFSELVRQATLEYPKAKQKQQGGMIQYEDGGEVHSRRMYNQSTGFNKNKSDLDGDGKISEYERKRGMAIAQSMGKKMMGGGMMPQYQEGGKINKYFEKNTLPYDENVFSDKMAQAGASQNPAGFPGAALYGLGAGLATMPMSDKQRSSGAALVLPALAALYGASKFRSDKAPLKRVMKGKQPLFREIDFKKVDDDVFMSSKKGWRQLSQNAIDSIKENNPELAEFYNFKKGGSVDYYQEGGQVQPRKQFELRNPDMFIGPPDSLVGRTYRNPFTGKYEDAEAEDRRIEQQTKRLLESMKKSNIPRSGQRMVMREGGPVPYQDGGQVNPNSLAGKTVKASDLGLENLGEVTDMPSPFSMSRPEFEAFTNSPMSEEEAEEMRQEQLSNLMSIVGRDMRIRPKQPDKYIVKNGKMSQTEMNIPKLSGAYLSSFGFETPYSQRQQALLQRKMIAPETLNPKVKGLINRALVQRLANEED